MQHLFLSIFQFFKNRKIALFGSFFLWLCWFLLFALKVKYIEDVYAIIPKDNKTEKIAQVFESSKFADKLIVVVSLKDTNAISPAALVNYADLLASQLQKDAAGYIKNLRYKIDEAFTYSLFGTIQNHLPVFLTEADYKKIDTLLQPSELQKSLRRNSSILSIPASTPIKNIVLNDPTGISFIALKKLQQLQYDDNFTLFQNHFVTRDRKTLLLFISPVYPAGNTGKNQLLFKAIDHIVDSLGKTKSLANIQTQYFGGAVVSNDNASQLRKDMMVTQTITVLFLLFFLSLYFKKKRAPALILVPVIYGAAFALAAIYFIKGNISVIALGTGSIVLGIAVNYSLHVFNHFRHTRNIQDVIKELSFPLTIGSLTTILGFFSLQYAASDMLKDLGLFAGFSLIGAAFCSLIYLPHFIHFHPSEKVKATRLDKLSSFRFEKNKWLVVGILLMTVVLFQFSKKVGFEADMTSLNYMTAKTKAAEKKLNQISGASLKSVYIVAEASTLNGALRKSEYVQQTIDSLRVKGLINTSAGVTNLFISDSLQQKRIRQWQQYWTAEKSKPFWPHYIIRLRSMAIPQKVSTILKP